MSNGRSTPDGTSGQSTEWDGWDAARRIVAKVERHPGELFPRVGFIVTNLSRPAERVVAFYNQRQKGVNVHEV